MIAPESAVTIEPIDHWSESLGLSPIMSFASFTTMPHQFCPLQYGEVFGDCRLRDSSVSGQGMDRLLSLSGQHLEEGASRRIRKRAKYGIGVSRFHCR